jgi:hypothetical protein
MPGGPLSAREHAPNGAARAYRHKQGGPGLELPEKRIRNRAGGWACKADEALPGEYAPYHNRTVRPGVLHGWALDLRWRSGWMLEPRGSPDGGRVRHAHPLCHPDRQAVEAAGWRLHARGGGLPDAGLPPRPTNGLDETIV